MIRKQVTKIKGIARVKKFRADQDTEHDTPEEIVEREFELTPEESEQVRKGKDFEIINGKPKIKR